MRIARVIHESSPFPLVALERDGALYDVGELDRIFATPFSPEVMARAHDFHTRVIALGGAGLDVLDDRLRSGDRPSAARLLPGTFRWLPPCDTDRALYLELVPIASYRIANARGLLGHGADVPFPALEEHPQLGLGVAAVLREDLRAAARAEVERAILGYAILNRWSGRDQEQRQAGAGARDVPAQLGPVLVTGIDGAAGLQAEARVDGHVISSGRTGGDLSPTAAWIAWVSRWVDLRAGDVIGVDWTSSTAAYGATVELHVERLGKLRGRPARGM